MKTIKEILKKSSFRLIVLGLLSVCSAQSAVVSVGIRNGAGTGVTFIGFAEPNVPIYVMKQRSLIDVAASTDQWGPVTFKVSGRTFPSETIADPTVGAFAWAKHRAQQLPTGVAKMDIPVLAFQYSGKWQKAIMRIVR